MPFDPSYVTLPYDPEWPRRYAAERARLLAALGDQVTRMEHVGSTAVPGLAAKPIVDIEFQVVHLEPMAPYRAPLERMGYRFTFDPEMPDLHFFGWPAGRPRQVHLHVSQEGSPHFWRVVAVRDYLRAMTAEAAAYAALKRRLTTAHPGDRDAYVAGKHDFVRALEMRALAWAAARGRQGRSGAAMATDTVTKTELLTAIERERAGWEALMVEIGDGRMEEPGVAGDWSVKDIAAHLTGWRQRSLGRIEAALQGEPEPPPPWPAKLTTDDEINAWIHERTHHRPQGEILREAELFYDRLRDAVAELPDDALADPNRFPWLEGQSLAESIAGGDFFGHFHDEHEPDIRAWLAGYPGEPTG